ncbi:thioredoxin family protein [Methanobrevibacter sp. DSM 116169]|uniref:thioredoxin family protein n=1 Tax=Methanobrevibacter sp. DSM 116169 TaxID=3242727 RepID=UPI0038FD06F9
MNNIFRVFLGIAGFLIIVAIAFSTMYSPNSEIDSVNTLNISDNYTQAINDGKTLNKTVIIYFTSSSCYYCDKFEDETLSNETVISKINEDYIFVPVNINEDPEIARKFSAYTTPTIVFLDSNGDVSQEIIGYHNSAEFIRFL